MPNGTAEPCHDSLQNRVVRLAVLGPQLTVSRYAIEMGIWISDSSSFYLHVLMFNHMRIGI